MKRLLLSAAAVAVAAAFAAVAAAVQHPKLVLFNRAPLEVRGTGFRSKEGVTVSAVGLRVHVRSSSHGRFVANFRVGDRCSGGRVLAVGSSGDRAALRLAPTLCPPA